MRRVLMALAMSLGVVTSALAQGQAAAVTHVICDSGCGGGSGGTSMVDAAAFTAGLTAFTPGGGVFNDGLADLSSGTAALARITKQRGWHVNLRDAAGVELGTSTTPLRVTEKPIDACGSTNFDSWVLLGAGTTTLTSTTTCLDSVVVNNQGTTVVTVLLTDGTAVTPLILLPTTPIEPGAAVVLPVLAGAKANLGLKATPGSASVITVVVHGRQ